MEILHLIICGAPIGPTVLCLIMNVEKFLNWLLRETFRLTTSDITQTDFFLAQFPTVNF